MKIVSLFIVLFLFSGCDHPESKTYERDQKVTTNLEDLESKRINTKENTATIENNMNHSENIEPSKLDIDNQNILKMETQNGVKFVWIEINGIRLRFIFDTGASSICISPSEANVLYRQGTLRKEDILDKEYFQDATGKISEGTNVNLRTVKIGNKILENIEATIVDNVNAPLLLGQSVLENFGKIEIDNENSQIIFK
jgi:aspartyl protease family protein